ncbi:hypothetical protein ACFQ22_06630 [Lentilactobacillus raoultii]|uniref:Uncharacterized protein n=1 Tax=Lentilactobacillus raoultii TaxID=1987503 RepID=A0ABW3PRV7_9LACO|nr:hypothetical protein [Lentilactobacillus raoultii]
MTVTQSNVRKRRVWMNVPQPVNAWVTTNSFGDGEWLKFQVGQIPKKGMNYAIVLHKGSYVKRARLISRSAIPKLTRSMIGQPNQYMSYTKSSLGAKGSWNPFQ